MDRKIRRVLTLAVIILSSILAILPITPVYATTETLTVDANGTYTQGTYVGGAGTFVNMQSDDGDTSYCNFVGTATVPLIRTFSFSNSAATSIASITLFYKVRWMSAGNSAVSTYATVGGVDFFKETQVITDTAYTLYSTTWTTNPATGLAWTLAQINASGFGCEFQGTYRWTYTYINVNYTTSYFPTVTTQVPTTIGLTSAVFNGNITDYGASAIDERGFVWDTVSHPVNPGNVDHAATAYANNWVEANAWTTGAFTYSAAVLVAHTTYYIRAVAHNTTGWAYGDEIQFNTISEPTVTLLVQTEVSASNAQLNAVITYDGEQLCDARFGWDIVTQAADANLYANHSDWVLNTYATGSNPYVVITGLAASTLYFFNVQIRNDHDTVQGVELSFTTPAAGLSAPTNFTAKPEANALNIAWTKDTNATGVEVWYSIASQPTTHTTATGTLAYRGTSGSHRLTGLTSGFTYYVSAWCYANGTYSATYAEVNGTTWAYNDIPEETTLGTVNRWFVTANSANLQKIPGHQLVGAVATTYSMPETTLWFILGIFMSVALGAFVYSFSNNTTIALITIVVGMFGGVMAGIYAGWMIFVIVIIGGGLLFVSARQ